MFRFIAKGWLCTVLVTGSANAAAPAKPEGQAPAALAAIVASVVRENPLIAAAEARLKAAEARAVGAGLWRNNPEIEYDSETAEVRTETVGVSQTVEWFSKPAARGRAADSRTESLARELVNVRQRVITGVLSGFVLVDQGRAKVALASDRTQSMSRFADLSERLFREGDISPSAAQAARVAATQAVMREQVAQIDLSNAEQELAQLTGVAPITWPSFDTSLPEPMNIDDVDVEQLPSVLAARFRREAADRDIKVAQWDRVPDPSVGVRYGDEGNSDLFGFRISIPIPVLNSGRSEVAAARADAVSAAVDLQAAQRSASIFLRETARRYEALRSSQVLWLKSGENAVTQQADVLQRRLDGGDIGVVEYLVQLQQLYDAQESSIELQGQAWVAWFQLLQAAGVVEEWIGVER